MVQSQVIVMTNIFVLLKFDLDLQETKDILLAESLSLDPTLIVTKS